jgi:hypothetical protein
MITRVTENALYSRCAKKANLTLVTDYDVWVGSSGHASTLIAISGLPPSAEMQWRSPCSERINGVLENIAAE